MNMHGVKAIPEGHHTITPHLIIRGAAAAIDFYKKAFGAKELMRMDWGGGKVGHAELQIGDSRLFLADEFPGMGSTAPAEGAGTCIGVHLYVEDCDKVFNTAVAAGAKVEMPPMNMFWGDRFAKVKDPFGHSWAIATHVEDVPPEEMGKRAQAAMAEMGKC